MTQQHPITPPPELVQQWVDNLAPEGMLSFATQAAQWGADQELEACCEWLKDDNPNGFWSNRLRTARRPKPPSLKEQALMALEDGDIGNGTRLTPAEVCIIRRALQQLPDD